MASEQYLGSTRVTRIFIQSPIYASRALSRSERNYGITELETLAVVWAISHFRHFLYRKLVTVFTDHTAVKAVLETPNPTGKHARWWNKVYGCGVREVRIVYRAGKETRTQMLSLGVQFLQHHKLI